MLKDIDSIKGFRDLLITIEGNSITLNNVENLKGNLYCSKCGDKRVFSVKILYKNNSLNNENIHQRLLNIMNSITANRMDQAKRGQILGKRIFSIPKEEFSNALKSIYHLLSPSLYECKCLQCNMFYTAIIYRGSKEQMLVLLPDTDGGVTTPHTPESVSYYLDQAYKAHTIGANSAAATMYRSSLEQILYEQDYKKGMLGKRIKKLEEDINNGSAPNWASQINIDFLERLKEIGNSAVHTEDFRKQAIIDNNLIKNIIEIISYLLLVIYEIPYKKNEKLKTLEIAKQMLNK
ncbi:DUF4145 domain-containing protein [Herbivorax sp. ANBcel31]|uniref:DUF4145 domain-containing protein n=1 Tax=Herbivorax sp. ANBcel31 TaxID=3069754 RepID=UPI0027B0294C|nr:DUF4145 domain-containing protein [Herbivorax sp. ANBcel31]MDQ2088138.1 DUF4145 domain-containing protein [Herbivorax sp. ANBcel31]